MKTRAEVSADKIRGGFYSPDRLVDLCLDRVKALTNGRSDLSVLEPGAGDGAFIRGLMRHPLGDSIRSVYAVEPMPEEAAKCAGLLTRLPFCGRVETESIIPWSCATKELFDVVVGNPPYVRYQFISKEDKSSIPALGERCGARLAGVSNLWIAVLIAALSRLRTGGVFALIIPTECLTGISAGIAREWLTRHVESLRLELFAPGSFPGVLQEVLIASGSRRERPTNAPVELAVVEHNLRDGNTRQWCHRLAPGRSNWTRYLLAPTQLDTLTGASTLPSISRLGAIAKFGVAAVTGANEYFSVDLPTVEAFKLHPWVRPLLPRTRHATGLIYSPTDHEETVASGARAMLLDFAAERPDPESQDVARRYLAVGMAQRIHLRYKCRIREPWYRVPLIRPGQLMMSKRSHRYHRVILNHARVVTTDTIYRGEMLPLCKDLQQDFVASFHNSLTLLSTELEGRSFGGGVLELVPTEIGRLVVPVAAGFADHLARLDSIARSTGTREASEELISETDALLVNKVPGLTSTVLNQLAEARRSLLQRRLDRSLTSASQSPD